MTKQATIQKFKSFIASITPRDRVAVVHHTDADGICSGFICAEALERLGYKPVLVEARAVRELNTSLAKKLKQYEITKTVCTDLVLDQFITTVERISEFCDLLIIDHHPRRSDVASKSVIVIKQTDLGIDKYYPASKLAYDLFSEVADIKDLDWVAACGVVGDVGYTQNKRFVDSVMRRHNVFPAQDLFGTDIGKAASYIGGAGSIVPNKIKQALRILKKANHPKDILKSELASLAKCLSDERDRVADYVLKHAEKYGDLVFCIIESKYRVRGMVINKLSLGALTNKTIVLLLRVDDSYVISARRHDRKLAVNDLLERATRGLENAGGGGHAPAAGGQVMVKDLAKFKKNLIRIQEEMSEK